MATTTNKEACPFEHFLECSPCGKCNAAQNFRVTGCYVLRLRDILPKARMDSRL